MEEILCTCGHSDNDHIDGCEQCFIIDCGCKEFEEVCEFCGGTGEITTMEEAEAGNPATLAPIGTKKCICQLSINDSEE